MRTPSRAEPSSVGPAAPTPWDPRLSARIVGALAGAGLVGLSVLAVRWDQPSVARARTVAAVAPVAGTTGSAGALASGDGAAPTVTTASASSASASTSTSSAGGPSTSGRAGSGSPPSSPTTTTVATAAPRAPSIHPGALHRPAAGRYAIRVIVGDQTTDGSLVVDPEQWQRRAVGGDARVENLVWTSQGATLFASGEPGADGACRWDHQPLQVPADLAEGRSWSSKAGCDSTISGRAVHLTRIETAAVRQRARTHIDGVTVDTWVIDRRVVLSIEGKGISTISDATSTELFAPDLGLPVFQMSRTQVPQPDGTVRTVEASEELLHLRPQAG